MDRTVSSICSGRLDIGTFVSAIADPRQRFTVGRGIPATRSSPPPIGGRGRFRYYSRLAISKFESYQAVRNGRDRRSENPLWVTRRKSAYFCLGPISGSHQGQRPKRLHSKAEYIVKVF